MRLKLPENFIITIDGPAGAGKTSSANYLSELLEMKHLITGYLYRAIAYELCANKTELKSMILQYSGSNVFVNNVNMTANLFSMEVQKNISKISADRNVRDIVDDYVKRSCKVGKHIVEGRNIGRDVLPHADIKFYMTADLNVRAQRRAKQLNLTDLNSVQASMNNRDLADSTRQHGQMRCDDSAIFIDTTKLTFREQIDILLSNIQSRI